MHLFGEHGIQQLFRTKPPAVAELEIAQNAVVVPHAIDEQFARVVGTE